MNTQPEQLSETLRLHQLWLRSDPSDPKGRGANLARATLDGANLLGANLAYANLTGANLLGATLPGFQLPAGELRGWKKAMALRTGCDVIVELIIPADARRTASLIGPKCRTERAVVVAVHGADEAQSGGQPGGFARLRYVPGESVVSHDYSDDPRVECAPGIHFFRTRSEAEEYRL